MSQVTGSCAATVNFQQTGTVGVGSAVQVPILASFKSSFRVAGALLDQCDLIYAKTLTFVASTPQTLDLTSLVDVLGNAIDFARVRMVAIRVQSQVDGFVLTVGASGTNEWDGILSAGGTIKVFPSTPNNDGFLVLQAPNSTGAVVSSTSKTLKLDPGANALGAVDVIIAGCDS